ncbi:uncharacterized protein LOC6548223 isoform X2 [Drosophila erecta]|uniref:uncharacterized protein LOC6548223 isoform X2 n=1 Tax=Drosophila erecta TaxID=7220 RepID=UPI000F067144|nr:uncharacterized protein LOC6548223 isoform X2 [Drosophila erecta]
MLALTKRLQQEITSASLLAISPPNGNAASEAFTIPLESDDNAEMPLNETVRQPPKRIQLLMQEAASSEPLTLEELEEKQLKAEQRRQELMQQKLEIIQKNAQMLMRPHEETPGEGDRNEGAEEQPEKV